MSSELFQYFNQKYIDSTLPENEDRKEILRAENALYYDMLREEKKLIIRKIIKNDIELGYTFKPLKKMLDNSKEKLKEQKANLRNDKYIFLTINPDPKKNIKPRELKELCEKAMNRKFVKKWHFVIEQRGTTQKELGKGMHAHLLFERNLNYKPAIIKRDLLNTFKKCYSTTKPNDKIYNFKKCGKEYYDLRLKYIQGNKTEEGKNDKMKMDKLFRFLKKIKSIYHN